MLKTTTIHTMLLAHNLEKGQRTRDVKISQDITFDSMLLTENTLEGLKKSGFFRPSPIQLHGIPLGKCGFDLLLEAKSGTGKTAVFTIIALEKLDLKNGLQAVILAPTREIAAQICDVIKQIGSEFEALKVEVVMGGLPVQEDISKFNKKDVHIVVGSPGRLRHLIQDKYITTSTVRLLVLDEADKLMERSFQADINYIFSVLPKQKQVIMSSATYPDITKTFIDKYVQNAQHIQPDSNSILIGVEQKITTVKNNSNIVKQTQLRFEELIKILSKKQFKQCLIFCNYQARVMELHKMLTREKWPAEQLYGQQDQTDRLDALKTLQEYKCRILISTDLAARGIDASNVDLVVNFEPPVEWQTYLHRIGRAGRFGSYGIAITILSEGKEEKKFKEILELLNVLSSNFWNDVDNDMHNNHDNEDDFDNTSLSSQISEKHINDSLVVNNEVENKHEKLWNMLTFNGTMQNKREIETFETLGNSFEKSNADSTIIQPFNALINSFQSHQQKGNIYNKNNSYELIKTQIMDVEKCFAVNKSAKKQETISKKKECINGVNQKENDRNSEYLAFSNKDKITVNNGNIYKDDVREINDKEIRAYDDNYLENNEQNNREIPGSNDFHESYLENYERRNQRYQNDSETQDASDALLRAGLPTSFGNPKIKIKKTKKKNKRMNRNRHNFEEYPDDDDDKDTEKYKQESERNVHTHETKLSHSGEDVYQDDQYPSCSNGFTSGQRGNPDVVTNDHGYNTQFRQYSITQSDGTYTKHFNNRKGMKHDGRNNNRYSNQSTMPEVYESEIATNGSDTSSHRPRQDYLNWYTELKMRVKQIELAVYIHELSKP